MFRITALVFAAIAVASIAHASLIPILDSGPTPVAGGFLFSYRADLQQDERLDPSATNGASCLSVSQLVPCNPPGTFFTVYDIAGFVSASTTTSGWYVTVQLSGLTPSTTLPADSGVVSNVTFTYTGPVVLSNGVVVHIPGFNVISTLNQTVSGIYTSQATKDVGIESGTTDQTIGFVPVPAGAVPENGTMVMIGCGLAAIGLLLRYRLRKTG